MAIKIPLNVALCPECSGQLYIENPEECLPPGTEGDELIRMRVRCCIEDTMIRDLIALQYDEDIVSTDEVRDREPDWKSTLTAIRRWVQMAIRGTGGRCDTTREDAETRFTHKRKPDVGETSG